MSARARRHSYIVMDAVGSRELVRARTPREAISRAQLPGGSRAAAAVIRVDALHPAQIAPFHAALLGLDPETAAAPSCRPFTALVAPSA